MASRRKRRNKWLRTAVKDWVYVDHETGVHILCTHTMENNGQNTILRMQYRNNILEEFSTEIACSDKEQFIGKVILSATTDFPVGYVGYFRIHSYIRVFTYPGRYYFHDSYKDHYYFRSYKLEDE